MSDHHSNGHQLLITRNGKSQVFDVSLRVNDRLAFASQARILDASQRESLITDLQSKFSNLDPVDLEEQILSHIEKLTAPDPGSVPVICECDPSSIIRPERFFRPGANGIAVPTLMLQSGVPITVWEYFIQHEGGLRERLPHVNPLEIDGQRLIIHPRPEHVSATEFVWSRDSRNAWLEGMECPATAEVLATLLQLIKKYVDLPGDGDIRHHWAMVLALFVITSYHYVGLPAVPYLWITGLAGSGKTRVLQVLTHLVFHPVPSGSISSAALFRELHEMGGTFLLDELENLLDPRNAAASELNLILNAGYKRGQYAKRVERVGDRFVPMQFSVYGAKVLASIRRIPDPLADRAIQWTMLRSDRCDLEQSPGDDPHFRIVRDQLYMLSLRYGPQWLAAFSALKSVDIGMTGRRFEKWAPLLSLAKWLEEHGAAPHGLTGCLVQHATRAEDEADEARRDGGIDLERARCCLQALASLLTKLVEQEDDIAKIRRDDEPTCQVVLEEAKELARTQGEIDLFYRVTPRKVIAMLKHYGLKTIKSPAGRKVFPVGDSLILLRRIPSQHGIDLEL